MIELRPPPALPAGNVGTPTKYILKQINRCQFPVGLIAKLGLEFPRMRAKGMYGSVALDYGESSGNREENVEKPEDAPNSPSTSGNSRAKQKRKPLRYATPDLSSIPTADQVPTFARTTKGHLITNAGAKPKKALGPQGDSGEPNGKSEDDGEELSDDGEEWDRHEALHDDVTSQERCKVCSSRDLESAYFFSDLCRSEFTLIHLQERLFEEGMEVVWEKGGSGLVFYTDAQHWDDAAGDFDAKTSDDWDIDMSGYYQEGNLPPKGDSWLMIRFLPRIRNLRRESFSCRCRRQGCARHDLDAELGGLAEGSGP